LAALVSLYLLPFLVQNQNPYVQRLLPRNNYEIAASNEESSMKRKAEEEKRRKKKKEEKKHRQRQ
jgi:hypothetical protein